jgi:GSCFA family/Polysaccharide biosynthesis enzyme WcbI
MWNPLKKVSIADVHWCYRTLLNRNPRFADPVTVHLKNRSLRALVEAFVASPEYRQRFATNNQLSIDDVLWCYRTLLKRNPESVDIVLDHLKSSNLRALVEAFVTSPEYKRRFSNQDKWPAQHSDAANIEGHSNSDQNEFSESDASPKFLIFGNCQAAVLAQLMESMVPGSKGMAIELLPEMIDRIANGQADLSDLVAGASLIFIGSNYDNFRRLLADKYAEAIGKIRLYPVITFSAFHPDAEYAEHSKNEFLNGAMGHYHSALALWGWKNGFCAEDTVNLFRKEIFQHLRYFDYIESASHFLLKEGQFAGIRLDGLLKRWLSNGCFMHSMNHPKHFVLADVARAVLVREHIEFIPEAEKYIGDPLANGYCWPVYPDIAERYGMKGHYFFKKAGNSLSDNKISGFNTLDEFVRSSFQLYAAFGREDVICGRLDSERYRTLKDFVKTAAGRSVRAVSGSPVASKVAHSSNPYNGLPDYQFWRRTIARQKREDVDPVVNARFQIQRTDKISTAGSCFAQHISRTLKSSGFNYYVVEAAPYQNQTDPESRNFGVFSARFGNIYTARQLLQLHDRAYQRFVPNEKAWLTGNGRYADPFRPQIEPGGFVSFDELSASQIHHLARVREMFETLDIFIFTLGLTEAWRAKVDGAVFPVAPGVVAGEMDLAQYEFVNFGTAEIVADMQAFMDRLHLINSKARIVLTVSPVPLIATYENRHILTSNTYSKSALRAAAEELIRHNSHCDYFPSYEVITGNYPGNQYFESDLRSVNAQGVDHVMRLFVKHYLVNGEWSDDASTSEQELLNEAARISEVVCDEMALDSES